AALSALFPFTSLFRSHQGGDSNCPAGGAPGVRICGLITAHGEAVVRPWRIHVKDIQGVFVYARLHETLCRGVRGIECVEAGSDRSEEHTSELQSRENL